MNISTAKKHISKFEVLKARLHLEKATATIKFIEECEEPEKGLSTSCSKVYPVSQRRKYKN